MYYCKLCNLEHYVIDPPKNKFKHRISNAKHAFTLFPVCRTMKSKMNIYQKEKY